MIAWLILVFGAGLLVGAAAAWLALAAIVNHRRTSVGETPHYAEDYSHE